LCGLCGEGKAVFVLLQKPSLGLRGVDAGGASVYNDAVTVQSATNSKLSASFESERQE